MAPRKGTSDNRSLLSPSNYDKDAPSYTSVPSTEDVRASHASSSSSIHLNIPDSGSSDDGLQASDDDREVLLEEEEREKLLSRGGLFGSIGRKEGVVIGKRIKRRKSRRRLSNQREEEGFSGSRDALSTYSDGTSSTSGSDDEQREVRRRFDEKLGIDRKPRSPSCRRLLYITVSLLTFLLLLLFGSLQLSFQSRSTKLIPHHSTPLSNGTHTFFPTTIYISLDGLRADYIERGLTPTIQSLINSGASTPYMIPSFPSVTFPNHWTLVTGLYPESHGIVGNEFYDPILKEEYSYGNITQATKPIWYGGAPIWSIAEENGIKTAIHMWPGSEQYIYHPEKFYSTFSEYASSKAKPKYNSMRLKPSYVDPFNKAELLPNKVKRILNLLDLPLDERPQLIAAYVPNIDVIGHKFGPNTTEENNELVKIDDMFHLLLQGLDSRNLTDLINIVVVSDHGMATVTDDRVLYIEDILGTSKSEVILPSEGRPSVGLRPQPGSDITKIYKAITETRKSWSRVNNENNEPPWKVYLRDVNMPERFHFSKNERIAPLWIIPDAGWAISHEDEWPRGSTGWSPIGIHGYDNLHPLMRAIFIAHGPAFRDVGLHGYGKEWVGLLDGHSGGSILPEESQEKEKEKGKEKGKQGKLDKTSQEVLGRTVKPFGNWEVYGIIGSLLFGTEQAVLEQMLGPHNGTFVGGVKGLGETVMNEQELKQIPMPAPPKSSISPSKPSASSSSLTPHHSKAGQTPKTLTRITTSMPSKSNSALYTSPPPPPPPPQPTLPTSQTLITTLSPPSHAINPPPPLATSSSPPGHHDNDQDKEDDYKKLSWWDYLKWKAQRLKESMENWWGQIWTEEMEKLEEDAKGKMEGKGPR